MKRRKFIQQTTLAAAGVVAVMPAWTKNQTGFPIVRTEPGKRKFTSPAVEALIEKMKKKLGDTEDAWLFVNCFPNTLDTTVEFETTSEGPDTYVITGDIDAMWLRDSTAQVWPYLPLMKEDEKLKQLVKGVIRRQVNCILLDPYANAFYKDPAKISEWKNDLTDMKPGIHERKWEIDSLCYPIRLSLGYYKATGDASIFDKEWHWAIMKVLQTFEEQQRFNGKGPYKFERSTSWATDGVPLGGYGYPAKPNGLICSMFRPSDDATIFPYLVPSNFFAAECLKQLHELLPKIAPGSPLMEKNRMKRMSDTILQTLRKEAIIQHPAFGKIYAYEINGYGSYNLMDDANIPSLLSLPYLVPGMERDPVYQNTRRFLLSDSNPFFYKGRAGEGIGGPHVGVDMIWPLSIIMRGITSQSKAEISHCLSILRRSHAGTGFMHEAFHKDDATRFTRKWFAWANTLYGELLWKATGS